jgi:hypothetical protein
MPGSEAESLPREHASRSAPLTVRASREPEKILDGAGKTIVRLRAL